MMMSVEGDDHVFKLDLSSHTSLWGTTTMMIFIFIYIHIVAVAVDESNILEEYERRFWGWPLSKENNGSSNVQLTVSVSVLYPIIMTSKFYLVFISLPSVVSKL